MAKQVASALVSMQNSAPIWLKSLKTKTYSGSAVSTMF